MMPSRRPPIITLTTDFGLTDHYVGTMKGVILSRCPDASIVDISHEIPAFSTYAGAYAIAQAVPFFPPGTAHVVVVDPGVGTSRKALVVEAGGQYFIAPDNGVLSLICVRNSDAKIWEISSQSLWLKPISNTFHGRDVFAPVAAAIAGNSAVPKDLGPQIKQMTILPDLLPAEISPGSWRGRVLSVDHFGNIVTNFSSADFSRIAESRFALHVGKEEITEFRNTFGEADTLCFAYFGSSGYLEVGINQRSAAEHLEVRAGELVLLRVRIDE
jgi:S-adenosyl-L-methionine hydrolase (adenosine-forming)